MTATTSRKAAFSLRAKPHAARQESSTPGPGQYGSHPSKPHVGLAPNAPCYTFGLRTLGDREAEERKPGPAGTQFLVQCLWSLKLLITPYDVAYALQKHVLLIGVIVAIMQNIQCI